MRLTSRSTSKLLVKIMSLVITLITRVSLMISWIGMGNVDPTVFYKDFYIKVIYC